MNENQGKLVAALRSGEFDQARDWLRTDVGYCCLGVACEVFRTETGQGHWTRDSGDHWAFVVQGYRDQYTLPVPVAKWLDMDQNGTLRDGVEVPEHAAAEYLATEHFHGATSLTRFNDAGVTFAEIADIIESGLVYPMAGV